MNIVEIREILGTANIRSETLELVEKLINSLQRVLSDYDFDQILDVIANGGKPFSVIDDQEGFVVIPGSGSGSCAPIVLAIAKGRDSRSRFGLPKVMREVRAHLIQCFEVAAVVILLTDRWDPDLMKESEADFSSYGSRQFGRKILIPMVSWKRKLTVYNWP